MRNSYMTGGWRPGERFRMLFYFVNLPIEMGF